MNFNKRKFNFRCIYKYGFVGKCIKIFRYCSSQIHLINHLLYLLRYIIFYKIQFIIINIDIGINNIIYKKQNL